MSFDICLLATFKRSVVVNETDACFNCPAAKMDTLPTAAPAATVVVVLTLAVAATNMAAPFAPASAPVSAAAVVAIPLLALVCVVANFLAESVIYNCFKIFVASLAANFAFCSIIMDCSRSGSKSQGDLNQAPCGSDILIRRIANVHRKSNLTP